EGLRPCERRVGAGEIVLQGVVARQVIPRGRILLLASRGQCLVQYLVRILKIFRPLVRKLGLGRAAEVQDPAVHEVMLRTEVALGRRPLLCGGGRGDAGGQQRTDDGHGWLHGHAHSLDLATSASASRSAARAISSGGRPSARAAAPTRACRSGSTYSGLMSSTSVASRTTRPASAACSATRMRNALG